MPGRLTAGRACALGAGSFEGDCPCRLDQLGLGCSSSCTSRRPTWLSAAAATEHARLHAMAAGRLAGSEFLGALQCARVNLTHTRRSRRTCGLAPACRPGACLLPGAWRVAWRVRAGGAGGGSWVPSPADMQALAGEQPTQKRGQGQEKTGGGGGPHPGGPGMCGLAPIFLASTGWTICIGSVKREGYHAQTVARTCAASSRRGADPTPATL